MHNYYVGIMSGTSADGVDAVVVDFKQEKPQLVASYCHPLPSSLRQSIMALRKPGYDEITRLCKMDVTLGKLFAKTVNILLKQAAIKPEQINAIGSHGHTISHNPYDNIPFTLQIGDPNIIAAQTGITTVTDFRRKDLAYGGQGAPLVPLFHQVLLGRHCMVVNIGGIANITYLPANPNDNTMGFDSGPGNTLLDSWCYQHTTKPFDNNGAWAKEGEINNNLLANMLADPYFKKRPPKSTGFEYFNLAWLAHYLQKTPGLWPQTVQATLTALTAHTIANAINNISLDKQAIFVCGGGVHNGYLMAMLQKALSPQVVENIAVTGLHPKGIEAMAFAWLAKQTLARQALHLTPITGSKKTAILGGIYYHDD